MSKGFGGQMEKIILVGAGGHAKTVVDTIERFGKYEIAGFLAPEPIKKEIYRGYTVIGCDEDMGMVFNLGIRKAVLAVGFIGNSDLRCRLYKKYKQCGFEFPVIIDPAAVVAKDAVIGEGTYIGRNAVINAEAKIGICCIINTAAIVEHECEIRDFSHIACAGVLCGNVIIGSNTFIGANATVIQECQIGNDCVIGAGSIVRKNVGNRACVVGNNRLLSADMSTE